MKYYATHDRKRLREAKHKLNQLDKAILNKCNDIGMNITRVIKCGKPYFTSSGSKEFATTDDILASITKLQKLGLLERR